VVRGLLEQQFRWPWQMAVDSMRQGVTIGWRMTWASIGDCCMPGAKSSSRWRAPKDRRQIPARPDEKKPVNREVTPNHCANFVLQIF
jgi:hypothetical protein